MPDRASRSSPRPHRARAAAIRAMASTEGSGVPAERPCPGRSTREHVEAVMREVARLQRPHAVIVGGAVHEHDGGLRGIERARARVRVVSWPSTSAAFRLAGVPGTGVEHRRARDERLDVARRPGPASRPAPRSCRRRCAASARRSAARRSSSGTPVSCSKTSSPAPAITPSLQRADQRGLVDHRAARDVDDVAFAARALRGRARRPRGGCRRPRAPRSTSTSAHCASSRSAAVVADSSTSGRRWRLW